MDRTADYDYELPPDRIAQVPADRRDGSRLLALGPGGVAIRTFAELPALLPAGAAVIVNDTRVIPARLRARKPSGGAVELLLLGPAGSGARGEVWRCLARSNKPLREGTILTLTPPPAAADAPTDAGGPEVRVVRERDSAGVASVEFDEPAAAVVERFGDLPLPPYIERPRGATAADRERYQTVFAREPGAVAAPTAGLHFTDGILRAIEARGGRVGALTLHVGLGTFSPVRAEQIDDHDMHLERYSIPVETAALVSSGRPVVAVGTTVVRALESAALAAGAGERVRPGPGETCLFIRPGFRFRVVDHLVTNFHLPRSTLLMLVCAFGGYEAVLSAYRRAVAERFRFYSYGDAMLVARGGSAQPGRGR